MKISLLNFFPKRYWCKWMLKTCSQSDMLATWLPTLASSFDSVEPVERTIIIYYEVQLSVRSSLKSIEAESRAGSPARAAFFSRPSVQTPRDLRPRSRQTPRTTFDLARFGNKGTDSSQLGVTKCQMVLQRVTGITKCGGTETPLTLVSKVSTFNGNYMRGYNIYIYSAEYIQAHLTQVAGGQESTGPRLFSFSKRFSPESISSKLTAYWPGGTRRQFLELRAVSKSTLQAVEQEWGCICPSKPTFGLQLRRSRRILVPVDESWPEQRSPHIENTSNTWEAVPRTCVGSRDLGTHRRAGSTRCCSTVASWIPCTEQGPRHSRRTEGFPVKTPPRYWGWKTESTKWRTGQIGTWVWEQCGVVLVLDRWALRVLCPGFGRESAALVPATWRLEKLYNSWRRWLSQARCSRQRTEEGCRTEWPGRSTGAAEIPTWEGK